MDGLLWARTQAHFAFCITFQPNASTPKSTKNSDIGASATITEAGLVVDLRTDGITGLIREMLNPKTKETP